MLSHNELIKLESNISDKTESDVQDNARINIIDQLSAQGFYTEAEDLIFKLNSSESEVLAKGIIENNRKLGIRKSDEYTKNTNHKASLHTNDTVIEENYDNICKYLETKKNNLTTSIVSHIKNRITKLSDSSKRRDISSKLARYMEAYKINLKQEILNHKQKESKRIKKLDESREKYLKGKSEMSDVLASMTKDEKSLYLDSELSLHGLISVVSRKRKNRVKRKNHILRRIFLNQREKNCLKPLDLYKI